MVCGMKIKTSITLEDELLNRIDGVLRERESRSAFLEDAARLLAEKRERARRDARDKEILNTRAAALNEEALGNLSFVSATFEHIDEP